ncbi:hypothetical protein GJV85_09995 [Sulfurimonas aquatica]|uniref:Uncharacterized protein n=1 Tax=Sulfurimonas aquatica TaxID=2672570 RepID=A0A975B1B6_9BACT|nr:hypothetical protein [Sulfurimonas aquatica]QSZ42424.1 hypothetical protein GJV85_09995 [Sulfurimonas aquatica]
MDIKDLNELRGEFEQLQKNNMQNNCLDDSCVSEDEGREDYPDYLAAIYTEIMPPNKSGIYFSRWDLKAMASELDESFALDVRERMFKKFMQWVATPEDMQLLIGQFNNNIDAKCNMYREYSEKYPSSKEIFDVKIKKADSAKRYLDKVYTEFFT